LRGVVTALDPLGPLDVVTATFLADLLLAVEPRPAVQTLVPRFVVATPAPQFREVKEWIHVIHPWLEGRTTRFRVGDLSARAAGRPQSIPSAYHLFTTVPNLNVPLRLTACWRQAVAGYEDRT